MTEPYILAIDNGTQSVRALLFDARGNLVDKARVEIEPYFSPRPGWAEQRPELYWEKLCEACQLLWSRTSVPREAIVALGLTTQRATMVNVDAQGVALRPAIVWLDQRRTEGQRSDRPHLHRSFLLRPGGHRRLPAPSSARTAPQSRHCRRGVGAPPGP